LDYLNPAAKETVLALGGGSALEAILLARQDAHVVICDISVNRLREARRILIQAGLADRVDLIACKAESLPLLDESVSQAFTKSVLIHTDLPLAASEVERILKPYGRAAFIEPMQRNPFVNAYRLLAAPKIWQHITTYFGAKEIGTVRRAFHGSICHNVPVSFLGFLSELFHFGWANLTLRNLSAALLDSADRLLFKTLPMTRRYAWFVVICISKRRRRL
jgi:SAM-dependent methyltransferase